MMLFLKNFRPYFILSGDWINADLHFSVVFVGRTWTGTNANINGDKQG